MASDPDPNWWPRFMRPFADEDPWRRERVDVAANDNPWGDGSYRLLSTALVAPDEVDALLDEPGYEGGESQSNGPHPQSQAGSFSPRFWVHGSTIRVEGFESLVSAWSAGGHWVMLPDPGFLMTYGLVPRHIEAEDAERTIWDEPSLPEFNVVDAATVTSKDTFKPNPGSISILRDYLEDYSTQRGMALVQSYFVQLRSGVDDEIRKHMGDRLFAEHKLPGRLLYLRIDEFNRDVVVGQAWGARVLTRVTGRSPIIEGRWDYGSLNWPGLSKPVTDGHGHGLGAMVYVRDTVLARFEGRQEFDVIPELGAVIHDGLWTVGDCRRVARDTIAIDVRKLYEGLQPALIRHWHEHAVDPPRGSYRELVLEPNVASRSKRIALGLCRLGQALAAFEEHATRESAAADTFVALSHDELNGPGWWKLDSIEPITRHIPVDLGEDQFLQRCNSLYKVVGEGLLERGLRRLVGRLGFPPDDTEKLGSFRLLELVLATAKVISETGLSPTETQEEVVRRAKEILNGDGPTDSLVLLNELRQLDAHTGGRKDALARFRRHVGTSKSATQNGWGFACDSLYDAVAEALDLARGVLRSASGDVQGEG